MLSSDSSAHPPPAPESGPARAVRTSDGASIWAVAFGIALIAASAGGCRSADPQAFAGSPSVDQVEENGRWTVINPYEAVQWDRAGHYDANLHTHTNFSDGRYDPHYAIDAYHAMDYEILALTDHDSLHVDVWPRALYPWTELNDIYHQIKDQQSVRFDRPYREVVTEEWQNRDPDELGMVSVPGSEISRTHHISSLFNMYAGGTRSEDTAFEEIAKQGGLAVFNHPGRYEHNVDWYTDFFARYPHVVGMEIYNQVDRYPVDRQRWDNILHLLMPDRPVWGLANDDTHTDEHFGRNRNVFLLPELTQEAVFDALKHGRFYLFVPTEQGIPPSVILSGARVRGNAIALGIDGEFERVDWVTFDPDSGKSQVIANGPTLSLKEIPHHATFVRAVIISPEGRTYTQPFGLRAR